MKRFKVTVEVIMTLAPGAELLEHFVDDDEDLGAHIKVGDKLFSPNIEWMIFEPRNPLADRGQMIGWGHGYKSIDDEDFETFSADEPIPVHDHRIKVIEE
jgi:hypothetical protein